MTKALLEAGDEYQNVDRIPTLLREIEGLKKELQQLREKNELEQYRNVRIVQAHARLREILEPLYNGLRDVFGELQESIASKPGQSAVSNDKWEIWKRKLGGKQAEFIQALLE